MSKVASIRAVTANIRNNPVQPRKAVKARVQQAVAQGGVIALQEMTSARQRAIAFPILWRHGYTIRGVRTPNPIAFPKARWTVPLARVHLVHKGKKHVSPNRYIIEVRAVHKATGLPIWWYSNWPVSRGHYANTAANQEKIPSLEWRIARLALAEHDLAKLAEAGRKAGATVIALGDFNDPHTVVLDAAHQVDIAHHSLDHIIGIPSPTGSIKPVGKATIVPANKHMDHAILARTFDVRGA